MEELSRVEGTSVGVSDHWTDASIGTGRIFAQQVFGRGVLLYHDDDDITPASRSLLVIEYGIGIQPL